MTRKGELLYSGKAKSVYATDDAGTSDVNQPITGNVTDNDNDPEGDNLMVTTTPLSGPTNGTVVLNTDGTFTFTPNSGFTGNDQFTFRLQ